MIGVVDYAKQKNQNSPPNQKIQGATTAMFGFPKRSLSGHYGGILSGLITLSSRRQELQLLPPG